MSKTPATEPVFSQTMQIGIVVPDLEAAIATYESDYGIGPWNVFEVGPEMVEGEVLVHGKPAEWRGRAAVTMVGTVMWELIEPLRDDDVFGRFLSARGGIGGVHHIAVATPDFDKVRRQQAERGKTSIMRGRFTGIDIDYLDTERELGVILEVFSGMPGDEKR